MNLQKLKQAEQRFLKLHPLGFDDPSLQAINKRHRMDKMCAFAQEYFSRDCHSRVEQTVQNMIKLVSRSSMVSMFEKPKFRDFVGRLDHTQKNYMVDSLIELLHGEQQSGFEALVDLLKQEKIAKWSVLTIIPAYFAPTAEVFVKPTTAKGVIKFFEVEGLDYKPTPGWEFYRGYRSLINEAREKVDKRLSPSNAAFSGFLMMSI